MALGTIMVAMAFAGCFLLARIPSAAFGFVLPIMIGYMFGMQIQGTSVYGLLAILSMVYIGMLAVCIQWSYARYVEQLLGEAAIKEQEQVISLLLRDFEETTSDWLWQINEDGGIMNMPSVADGNKQQSAFLKPGDKLVDIFKPCAGLKTCLLYTSPSPRD